MTNGIGGYASQSLAGSCTRSYHGLLVSAIDLPTNRFVTLAQLEETIEINGVRIELATNQYPGAVHPNGYQFAKSFECNPSPTFNYEIAPGVTIRKRIFMEYGQNSTYIEYLLGGTEDALPLELLPLVTFRSYHNETQANEYFPTTVVNTNNTTTIRLAEGTALQLHCKDPHWTELDYWHYRIQHTREQERGLAFECDLYCPGKFTVMLQPGTPMVFCASTETLLPDLGSAWDRYIARQDRLLQDSKPSDSFSASLVMAADAFVIEHPSRTTVIAGYPWFTDWGRDTMIALPGLCLVTGKQAVARKILLSFANFVSEGMIPNRFPDAGEVPEYNTVDATLWFVRAVYAYNQSVPNDMELIKVIWPKLIEIVECHLKGTRYNIHVDHEDGLLFAGEPGVQLTWMDAKVDDWVVTPRIGKPVEINALWYDALMIIGDIATILKQPAQIYFQLADQVQESFLKKFVRLDGKGLADVVTNDGQDLSIRPNQIFAVNTVHSLLPEAVQKAVVDTIQSELLTPFGLRTLSPKDPNYRSHYGGDQYSRDSAYHQGIVWPWLLGAFAESHYKVYGDAKQSLMLFDGLIPHLFEAGIGTISEIFDAEPPFMPNGCYSQAWSVATVLQTRELLSKISRAQESL